VAVVQAGRLSGAADRLNVSLPTLSRRIRALETAASQIHSGTSG
jgi:DNA-binding transcriptional LysR family regulator